MRKLSWACDQAQTHHGLAVVGISEASVQKKPALIEGSRREVSITSEGRTIGSGEYWVNLEPGERTTILKSYAEGCVTKWWFTYPDWKLRAFSVSTCNCR